MTTLGLDIGTTTISASVLENNLSATVRTIKNNSFITGKHSWEKLQNPKSILSAALCIVQELMYEFPDISRIGITGQQHGILYLNQDGVPVSPLYIWQDERGNQPFDKARSYASYLSERTGHNLATGFGTVTHFYNLKNNLVPDDAVTFCTIPDYIAMMLGRRTTPAIHSSNAASFGLFDLQNHCFLENLLLENEIDPDFFPALAKTPCIGMYEDRIPVFSAIGDNQASFLGATQGQKDCMLLNIGTGAQFSAYSPFYTECSTLETRPYLNNDYLLVGSSLCGGRAYALLEALFRATTEMVTGNKISSCYDAMSHTLETCPEPTNLPRVIPFFQGTRNNPEAKASITNLDTENLRPLHLIYGTMYGMADELYSLFEIYRKNGGNCSTLFGSGNCLRKNPHLRQIIQTRFHLPLTLSQYQEEAACGAALFASLS